MGTGLFDFGDRDGRGDEVRLQHPLGVAVWPDGDGATRLLIADTYNGKIKRLDPASRQVTTLQASIGVLNEPGGLSAAGGTAWIADTNHHAVRVLDLEAGQMRRLTLADPDGLLAGGGGDNSAVGTGGP